MVAILKPEYLFIAIIGLKFELSFVEHFNLFKNIKCFNSLRGEGATVARTC